MIEDVSPEQIKRAAEKALVIEQYILRGLGDSSMLQSRLKLSSYLFCL